jgi:single-strand DNA-binding protein
MNGINSCTFVGNLTRDAELSYTNTGFAICNIGIAVNRSKKVGDSWEDRANFFDLKGIGKLFESLSQYLTRGSKVAVECHAEQERWEKDGAKRSKIVFIIDNIELVGGKKQEQEYSPKNDPRHNSGFADSVPF